MNIKELYENREAVISKAFEELQAREQLLTPKLLSPIVLKDNLVSQWLALNYVFATDFKADGSPVMGEVGGIIPTDSKTGKQALAIAEASIERVMYATPQVQEAEDTGDKKIISTLEKKIKMPLEYRGNVTVVNGNRNVAHYDFTSSVALENPLDSLKTNLYLILDKTKIDPVTVLSDKRLEGEQYVFNVPVNEKLFEKLKNQPDDKSLYETRLEFLKSNEDLITPDNFITGFNFAYRGKDILLRPVIGEREMKTHSGYLRNKGLEAKFSPICYLGVSDALGDVEIREENILK